MIIYKTFMILVLKCLKLVVVNVGAVLEKKQILDKFKKKVLILLIQMFLIGKWLEIYINLKFFL